MKDEYTAEIVVTTHAGLDAPTAARFVRMAACFDADIMAHCRGAAANAKSIIAMVSLCARQGDTLRVVASGADAIAALEDLGRFFTGPMGVIAVKGPFAASAEGEDTDKPAPDRRAEL